MCLFQYIFNHAHHAARNRARYLLIDLAAHRIGQIISNALVGFFAPAEQAAQKAAHHAVLLRRRGSGLVGLSLRFGYVVKNFGRDAKVNRFVTNLAVAFVPAAIVGLLFSKQIKTVLFNPISVATALVLGGFVILWVERRQSTRKPKVTDVDDMKVRDALVVGLAQILALVPGTSRSGSTIMGGMLWGLDRKVATEFSFFLAVPVMIAATVYDVSKHYSLFSMQDIGLIAVGFVAAFASGLLAVKALLKFVATKNYVPFAYYRIVFGGLILLTWAMGWVKWD